MPFKIDYINHQPIRWNLTPDGAESEADDDYRPVIFVGTRNNSIKPVEELDAALDNDPKITRKDWVDRFTALGQAERNTVLRVELERVDEVDTLAREIRNIHEWGSYSPGTFRLFNVDFSPEFRYCLETSIDPAPTRDLRITRLSLPERAIANQDITRLRVESERLADTPGDVLTKLTGILEAQDPDVLVLSASQIVPVLFNAAERLDYSEFQLGRLPGYQQLAGESTFDSYGRIGHSPARYNVPGRAIIDESNSFMLGHAGLHGILDLVERSWKPIQEAGWASIGNLLTAIQIRKALDRDILIPWNKSDPEQFKSVETHHAADRGGHTFDPDVGFHESVHELDFSSLYPNIMIEYNVSPETVRCACHSERSDVPELGYAICPERGFIPDVLEPIVTDRDRIKQRINNSTDDEEIEVLEARSDALKWILVTCFGYQGYKNSKFGRIEAHEAINAYARDILLTTKEIFEANGWRVVHGIVDSIWVQESPGEEQASLSDLADQITETVGIRLEYEHEFDWVCFVPMRRSDSGALTKYFGKIHGEEDYKLRGIELRQRSTPGFIAERQRAYLDILDEHREPEPVIEQLKRDLSRLDRQVVPAMDLVIRKRASKPLEAYTQSILTVAALERYLEHGIEKSPGQDVEFIVTDNGANGAARVRLPFEDASAYDSEWYKAELVRATESVLSPLGWRDEKIGRVLRSTSKTTLQSFTR